MELKLKLVTTSPGGWVVVGGWTKTKLMLFSTQVEVGVELKLELSLAIVAPNADRLERRPLVPKVIQNNIGPENMYEDPVITAIWLRGSLFSKLCLLLDSN